MSGHGLFQSGARRSARRVGRPPGEPQRGIVLLLVVVIVTISAMIGGTAALSTTTERSAASAARELAQARAAAWSGVQGVMAELADQREDILAGAPPILTESWELFAGTDGRRAVVRLIDLTPEADGMLIPESGRLDVNSASKQMLVDLGLDDALAGRIVAARGERPFASTADLLRVRGITAEMLLSRNGGEAEDVSGPGSSRVAGQDGASPVELGSLLTVFAFDPNIQSGIGGGDAEEFRGRQRVNLGQPWSDRLRDALVERFGQDAADGVQRIMADGTTFQSDKDVIVTLRRLRLPPESWAGILDVFTTSDDEYLLGRVDLRSAPQAVLASVPGITPEQARAIVAARERLDQDVMASPAWLVTEGLVTEQDFESIVDHVTTRCMQWRLRLEAGIVPPGQSEAGIGGPLGGGDDESTAALRPRVVLEAVVDISSQRARLAYLRDVSLLETAQAVLGDPGLADELGLGSAGGDLRPEDEAGMLADPEPSEPAPPDGEGSARQPDGGSPEGFPERPGEETSRRPGESAGGDGSSSLPGSSEFRDRRIGRWTTQGGKP